MRLKASENLGSGWSARWQEQRACENSEVSLLCGDAVDGITYADFFGAETSIEICIDKTNPKST